MSGLRGLRVVSSRQDPVKVQMVGSVGRVLRVRLLEMKARKTLYWIRWRRWSEERGKVKGGGSRVRCGWMPAEGADPRGTRARSAVEADMPVRARRSRGEVCGCCAL